MNRKIDIKPEIKTVNLCDIKPAPYNPREIEKEALLGLKWSLRSFGYIDLIVVNKRNMQIVGGNQRYKVLMAEGLKRVPVVLVDVEEVQEKAMNVSLNNPQIAPAET